MGSERTISHDKWPKQSYLLNKKVRVCFNYNTLKILTGVIVRDDVEEPHRTIIKLDDGRYILGTECQFGWDDD
jgi:hypothetical protein